MQNHTSFLLPAPPPRWLALWPFLVDSLSSVSWKHLKTEINADTSNLICNLYTESDIFVAQDAFLLKQDVFVLVTFVGYIFNCTCFTCWSSFIVKAHHRRLILVNGSQSLQVSPPADSTLS